VEQLEGARRLAKCNLMNRKQGRRSWQQRKDSVPMDEAIKLAEKEHKDVITKHAVAKDKLNAVIRGQLHRISNLPADAQESAGSDEEVTDSIEEVKATKAANIHPRPNAASASAPAAAASSSRARSVVPAERASVTPEQGSAAGSKAAAPAPPKTLICPGCNQEARPSVRESVTCHLVMSVYVSKVLKNHRFLIVGNTLAHVNSYFFARWLAATRLATRSGINANGTDCIVGVGNNRLPRIIRG
jgi:hypothetical protein